MTEEMYGSLEWQAYTFAGLVLVPRKHLADTVRRTLPEIRERIQRAEQTGIPRAQVLDCAWDELASRIAPHFIVSRNVMQKRLDFDGFSAAQL